MLASLLAVGVVVLVLWAAATGPGTVLEGEGRDRVPLSEPTPTSQSAEAGTGEQSRTEREPREVPAWLRAVVRAVLLVLEVALLVALAWVLWRALRWAWQRWDARARPATQAEGLTGEEELLDTEVLAEVLLGGAALLLAARSYRHRAARALLRLAGLGVWVALLVDLAASLQAGAGLLVGASAVAVGLALVAAAVATGRGWRSAWWSRRAEVLEGLAGAFALAALVPATGLFRLLWENVPDV